MSDKIEVNRRRVLGGLVTIGAAGAAIGAGTFAAFSDTEESTGNTIQAGTLDLGDPETTDLELMNAVPGDTIDATITSAYSGDVDASVEIDAMELNENDAATNDQNISPEEFAAYFEVTTADLIVGGDTTNLLDSAPNENSNGRTDLEDLAAGAPYSASNNATAGDDVQLSLEMTFVDESGQNDAQADGVDVDVTLYAEQV